MHTCTPHKLQEVLAGVGRCHKKFWQVLAPSMVWRGVEGCGGVWRGVEGCGGLWRVVEGCGGVWRGVEGCGGLWRAVEGCGGVWRGVEGCGGVWRGVEGCGGVWRAVEGRRGVCTFAFMSRQISAVDTAVAVLRPVAREVAFVRTEEAPAGRT